MGALDHLVINALAEADAAADLFRALGFGLTPKGVHTLGSVNYLMMTPGAYLEIVGVPREGRQRAEVLESPRGLSGLVLRTDDADATHARLAAEGFEPLEPLAFSRPVTVRGETAEARFRTVRLTRAAFPAGRAYFCHHLTPELVWREEWFAHPNGFRAIDRVELEHPDPEAEAARLARAFEGEPVRRGDAPGVLLDDAELLVHAGAAPRFRTARLVFERIGPIAARAEATPGAAWTPTGPDAGMLALPALDTVLDCAGIAGGRGA